MSVEAVEDSRLLLGIRLERLALILRYGAWLALAAIFLSEFVEGGHRNLAIITAVVLAHSAFVHTVFWTRRYHWFVSPLNFFIHLTEISLVVQFTGAEKSDLFVLYLFLIMGYTAYRRRFARIMVVAAISCCAYALIISIEWYFVGIRIPPGIILVKLLSILICGWLVATLSELLRRTEDASQVRARALASSEAALRTTLDSTADPILVYDANGLIADVNDQACEFLALPRQEVLGKPFSSFLFDDGTLSDKLAEAQLRGEYHGEQVFLSADGRERTVELHVRSYVRDQQRFFVAVGHDITERKNLQEATHLANVNLARLNRELQQVNELKTGLLTAVSQRIRSPLTAILGYLDMLLADEFGPIAPDQRKALQRCRRGAQRIAQLIDESLQTPAGSPDERKSP